MTPVCVLRSGGDFTPAHAQWLARQVPGLVCLSDVPVPGVPTIGLEHDWPGWWAKMEMFGPALDGDVLMIDLDTVVLSLPEQPAETTVLTDFTRPDIIGSGFMYVTAADRARVWAAWLTDPAGHMARCARGAKRGDQGFLVEHLADAARWGDEVVSYKVHCRAGVPAGAQVVCFHGKPRPWQVRAPWIPELPGAGGFWDLMLAHKGKRICVMGGADRLAADLEGIEADIYISTNAHGCDLRRPDYVLAMDEIHGDTKVPMRDWIRARTDAPIIGPHPFADYQLATWPMAPRFVLSGMVAVWAAYLMGAKVVLVAGMDGYGDAERNRDEPRKISRDVHCPVRVVNGGPLTRTWPAYDPAERFGRYQEHPSIRGWLGVDEPVTVRVRKPTTIRGAERARGFEIRVMRHEVARQLKHRMVEEV